jgi:hypothetical protein
MALLRRWHLKEEKKQDLKIFERSVQNRRESMCKSSRNSKEANGGKSKRECRGMRGERLRALLDL